MIQEVPSKFHCTVANHLATKAQHLLVSAAEVDRGRNECQVVVVTAFCQCWASRITVNVSGEVDKIMG